MGLDQFNLSAFWQIIGLKRRSRAIWASGSDCRLPLQRRIGTRRDPHPCVWFVQSGDRLGPGEAFLDPLANDLADSIARMPRGAAIAGGGAVGRVLRHMRSNVQFPQIGDEVLCVVTFVGARVRRRAPGERRTIILMAASRSAVPVAGVSVAPTTSPCRFSIKACPM